MRTILKIMTFCLLAAFWLLGSLPHGQCSEIMKSWQDEDKRLLTPVTFTASSIYLGELLEKLTKQTGVSVAADDHEAGSGTLVTVHWTQVPLADALNSLWSLLSYNSAEWTWEKTSTKEGNTYRLLRPGAAREFGSHLKTLVFTAYAEQAALMASAADMSPEQIKHLAKAHPELEPRIMNAEHIQRLRIYATLPEATRLEALTNPEGVKIAVTDLPATSQEYLIKDWKEGHGFYTMQMAGEAPKTFACPPHTFVRIKSAQFDGAPCPTLFFRTGFLLENGREMDEGGISFIGGYPLDVWLKTKLEAMWLLPGDSKRDVAEDRKLKAKEDYPDIVFNRSDMRDKLPREEQKRVEVVQKHMVDYRLRQMAEAAPLSYTARIGQQKVINYSEIKTGMKLETLLREMYDAEPALLHKWRDGVLLLTDGAWYHSVNSSPTPYEIIAALRAAEKANGGFVPLRSLAMAAERLTSEQLKQLKAEFPAMEYLVAMQDVLRLYYHDAAWERAGATLTPDIVQTLTAIPHNPLAETLKDAAVVSARISDVRDKQTPQLRQIEIQLLTADGTIAGRYGFYDEKRKPPIDAAANALKSD